MKNLPKSVKDTPVSTILTAKFQSVSDKLHSLFIRIWPTISKFSRWAEKNPISARALIVCCHILIILNALYLGTLLYLSDWGESNYLIAIAGGLFFVAYWCYPEKDQLRFAYFKQKMLDFSFVMLSSTIIALSMCNFLAADSPPYRSTSSNLTGQPVAKFVVNKPRFENKSPVQNNLISEVMEKMESTKSKIRSKKRSPKKASKGRIVIRVILTVFATVILGMVVVGASCGLFCVGNPGAAIMVLVFGGAGVIGGAILAFRALGRSKRKAKADDTEKLYLPY